MSDETIGEVVVLETTRQTVILVFSLVGTVLMLYAYAKFAEPDAFRRVKTATALWAKRYAQKRVDWWQRIADKAATIYNIERY
jgi:hypothetical protein